MRESGCHTFSLTARSSYTEIQNIARQVPCISKPDKYHLNISHQIVMYKAIGVKILLNQSLVHSSWIELIVNPSSLLAGKYCPTALFCETDRIPPMKKKLREILDACKIEKRLKEFKPSRFDVTQNQYCINEKDLENRLDLFRKFYVMPRYEVESDKYSWTIHCKSSEFSVYNKTYELKKRHGISIEDQILRLELRLSRKRILQLTEHSDWEKQLIELCGQVDKQLNSFLHRLYQDCGEVVTQKEALEKINHSSFRSKTKKKLRKLVNLAVTCESLNDVQKKMKLNKKQFKRLLDRFYELEISPVTQANEEKSSWFVLKKRS